MWSARGVLAGWLPELGQVWLKWLGYVVLGAPWPASGLGMEQAWEKVAQARGFWATLSGQLAGSGVSAG